jgi:alkanesulfonate monooxygenase SsuD/methylene tetrahydromethanopterin reductase-like flavin-dependent oxidoreductase (luciferase family)
MLRIGISLASFYAVADVRLGARFMVERARAARNAGLDSLFVGDHHVTPQPYYQNTPILGRLLAEWGDRPAGALYLLPLHHPVLLAEHVGTLAAIALGPFVLQCALGRADRQARAFGVETRERPSRFEQSLAIVRRLLRGEEVSSEGHWRFSGARVSPLPPTPLAVWIGASAPPAIDRAARLGDAWIGAPDLDPESARAQLELYRERRRAHGLDAGTAVLRRDVFVGRDDAEAEAIAGPIARGGYRGFDPSAVVYGSPERVAGELAEFAAMGYTEILVRSLVAEQEPALSSIARLAEVKRRLECA